ncbi:unnamed protein product [Penicillium discolor]
MEVRDLVDEGGVDLVAEFVDVLTLREVRFPVDDDAIGQLTHPVLRALRQREAVVQAEQIEAAVLGTILHDEDDVLELLDHLVWQLVEFVDHEGLEGRGVHVHPLQPTGTTAGSSVQEDEQRRDADEEASEHRVEDPLAVRGAGEAPEGACSRGEESPHDEDVDDHDGRDEGQILGERRLVQPDELGNEGEEEDDRLGIQQVDPEATAHHRPVALPGIHGIRRVIERGSGAGQDQPDAEVHQATPRVYYMFGANSDTVRAAISLASSLEGPGSSTNTASR